LNEIHTVLKPEGGALGVTWNPDQTRFATVNGFRNPTVKLWDWDSTNYQLLLVQEIQAASDQYGVFWSPDGKLLATLADDDQATFQIWDILGYKAKLQRWEISL
jgi:WD40 repeat protein